MDSLAPYVSILRTECPDLKLRSVRALSGGQFNHVLAVTDASGSDWIFRFPRYPQGLASLLNEVEILSRIQGRTALPVPDPVYVSRERETPERFFMGYRALPGEPLTRAVLDQVHNLGVLDRIASSLTGFLNALHSLDAAALGTNLPVKDGFAEWADLYARIRLNLFPHMRPDARQGVARRFEAFFAQPDLHAWTPALRHGDFGFGNILYDPVQQSITGVIDFGFAGIGDPALDLAAASTLGEPLYSRIARRYFLTAAMSTRADFYLGTYALQEALHGLMNSDAEAFESGIAGYR
jgi:aminoglycoside 2''-phosphotransferase